MSLPGPRDMWDAARVASHELAPADRHAIELIAAGDQANPLERLLKAGGKKPTKPTLSIWGKFGRDRDR